MSCKYKLQAMSYKLQAASPIFPHHPAINHQRPTINDLSTTN
jgi:hypothetical protein